MQGQGWEWDFEHDLFRCHPWQRSTVSDIVKLNYLSTLGCSDQLSHWVESAKWKVNLDWKYLWDSVVNAELHLVSIISIYFNQHRYQNINLPYFLKPNVCQWIVKCAIGKHPNSLLDCFKLDKFHFHTIKNLIKIIISWFVFFYYSK